MLYNAKILSIFRILKTIIVQSNQTIDIPGTKNDEAIDHFPPFDVSNINCFFMWFK